MRLKRPVFAVFLGETIIDFPVADNKTNAEMHGVFGEIYQEVARTIR